ncbi:hypothetical protein [Serinicoccus sediminis]|uniref:hypothetical protein n=1 Tax=Serinicoccus sediminis TaxID=2306021 RepID=UPI001021A356|nr:hypothetical protein [Serinicoccus sediminis]
MSTATQTRHPWRAVVRTSLQVGVPAVLALGLVVPEVVRIVLEEVGARTDVPDWLRVALLGTAAVVTAVSAILARVMAIPQVEALLERVRALSWMAAEPPAARHTDHDGDGVADHAQT